MLKSVIVALTIGCLVGIIVYAKAKRDQAQEIAQTEEPEYLIRHYSGSVNVRCYVTVKPYLHDASISFIDFETKKWVSIYGELVIIQLDDTDKDAYMELYNQKELQKARQRAKVHKT